MKTIVHFSSYFIKGISFYRTIYMMELEKSTTIEEIESWIKDRDNNISITDVSFSEVEECDFIEKRTFAICNILRMN